MNNIKVTVCIPVYNQQDLVIRAINSIPKRENIEIIVIDDGSTDKSFKSIVETISKKGYRNACVLKNITNKGVGYTVNRGYDLAERRIRCITW